MIPRHRRTAPRRIALDGSTKRACDFSRPQAELAEPSCRFAKPLGVFSSALGVFAKPLGVSPTHSMGSTNHRLVSRNHELVLPAQHFRDSTQCLRTTAQRLHDAKQCRAGRAEGIADAARAAFAQMTLLAHARNDSALRPAAWVGARSDALLLRTHLAALPTLFALPAIRCSGSRWHSAAARHDWALSRTVSAGKTTRCFAETQPRSWKTVSGSAKPHRGFRRRDAGSRNRSMRWHRHAMLPTKTEQGSNRPGHGRGVLGRPSQECVRKRTRD